MQELTVNEKPDETATKISP